MKLIKGKSLKQKKVSTKLAADLQRGDVIVGDEFQEYDRRFVVTSIELRSIDEMTFKRIFNIVLCELSRTRNPESFLSDINDAPPIKKKKKVVVGVHLILEDEVFQVEKKRKIIKKMI
jgi:hypothetical protein